MTEPAFPGIRGENGCGNETRILTPNGENLWIEHNQGISIRDYFAAAALSTLASGDFSSFRDMAFDAYGIADAMLAERSQTNEPQ